MRLVNKMKFCSVLCAMIRNGRTHHTQKAYKAEETNMDKIEKFFRKLSKKEQENHFGFPALFYFPCHTGSSLISFFLSKVVALSMLMA